MRRMEGGRKMAYEDLITINAQECGTGQCAKKKPILSIHSSPDEKRRRRHLL